MTTVIAVVNQKGGAGKTTVSGHLVHAARRGGKKALAVDMDKQASFSLAILPADNSIRGLHASDLFDGTPSVSPERVADDLSIIRSDKLELARRVASDRATTEAAARNLRSAAEGFDVCIIDTAGSLGEDATLYAALMAADYIVCPFQVGLSELAALQDLWVHIEGVRRNVNPRLKVLGLLPCKINTRSTEEGEFLAMLRRTYGKFILPHILAERAAVKQAVARRVPVWQGTKGDGHRKAGHEWLSACEAILKSAGVK
jgi:chromosome partitioning protein